MIGGWNLPDYKFGETNFYFQNPFFYKDRIYVKFGVNCFWRGEKVVPDKEKEVHVALQITWQGQTPTKEILKVLFTTCVSLPNPRHLDYLSRRTDKYVCPYFDKFYQIYEEELTKTRNQEKALKGLVQRYKKLKKCSRRLRRPMSIIPEDSHEESMDDADSY
eukprot:GHVP01029486.1.p1 GENE.GHVP01029486.1~~GHVP01029486.1.p1  ORF type:complete len:162 (+),score=21.92 GHVP01029486.1:282-767(+)